VSIDQGYGDGTMTAKPFTLGGPGDPWLAQHTLEANRAARLKALELALHYIPNVDRHRTLMEAESYYEFLVKV
jgi:hypothetical protein